jgi:hypothetical protein
MSSIPTNDTIVVVNRSTVLTDDAIREVIPAFQQSANDVKSVWGWGATIEFVGLNDQPPDGAWQLEILDHTDTPGAGGYHLDQNGQVSGKVFAGDAIDARAPWTIDATHEQNEMICNPFTNDTALVKLPHMRLQWFRECGDPVEGDGYGYLVNGVWVTDFVTPAYAYLDTGPYDFKGHLHDGCPALLPGGYITLYDPILRRYIQHFAQQADMTMSRRARAAHRPDRLIWG